MESPFINPFIHMTDEVEETESSDTQPTHLTLSRDGLLVTVVPDAQGQWRCDCGDAFPLAQEMYAHAGKCRRWNDDDSSSFYSSDSDREVTPKTKRRVELHDCRCGESFHSLQDHEQHSRACIKAKKHATGATMMDMIASFQPAEMYPPTQYQHQYNYPTQSMSQPINQTVTQFQTINPTSADLGDVERTFPFADPVDFYTLLTANLTHSELVSKTKSAFRDLAESFIAEKYPMYKKEQFFLVSPPNMNLTIHLPAQDGSEFSKFALDPPKHAIRKPRAQDNPDYPFDITKSGYWLDVVKENISQQQYEAVGKTQISYARRKFFQIKYGDAASHMMVTIGSSPSMFFMPEEDGAEFAKYVLEYKHTVRRNREPRLEVPKSSPNAVDTPKLDTAKLEKDSPHSRKSDKTLRIRKPSLKFKTEVEAKKASPRPFDFATTELEVWRPLLEKHAKKEDLEAIPPTIMYSILAEYLATFYPNFDPKSFQMSRDTKRPSYYLPSTDGPRLAKFFVENYIARRAAIRNARERRGPQKLSNETQAPKPASARTERANQKQIKADADESGPSITPPVEKAEKEEPAKRVRGPSKKDFPVLVQRAHDAEKRAIDAEKRIMEANEKVHSTQESLHEAQGRLGKLESVVAVVIQELESIAGAERVKERLYNAFKN
jgi:hypothetical protein